MTTSKLNIAVIGMGRVGGSVISRIIEESRRVQNCPFQLVAVCDSDKQKKLQMVGVRRETDAESIINDSAIDVVIECIGAPSAAHDIAVRSITKGKHVITCNRALVAIHGEKLVSLAQAQGVHFRFEAAAMGAVPTVASLFHGLGGQAPRRIYGVLNAAANYVLTRMHEHGESAEDAVAAAEELGIKRQGAEVDLSGKDALQSLATLRFAAFGVSTDVSKVPLRSLYDLESVDTRLAQQLGFSIKQVAFASAADAWVQPVLVDNTSLLGTTNGLMNGLVVETPHAGDVFFAGNGHNAETCAGGLMSDLVALSRGARAYPQHQGQRLNVVEEEKQHYFYLRFPITERENLAYDFRIHLFSEFVDERSQMVGCIVRTDMNQVALKQNLTDFEELFVLEVLVE